MGLGMRGADWPKRVRCKASPVIRKTLQLLSTPFALHSCFRCLLLGPRSSQLTAVRTAWCSFGHAWLTQCRDVCPLMPHLNRSPSSPSLRDLPKQAADELLLSRPSMARPKPSLYHASIRRFSSRRPRPSVASITDIFVGSLVLAGFCHEHSPRSRCLSTIPLRTSEHRLRRFRAKGMVDRGHLSVGRCLDYSRASVPSSPSSRSRSWLSTSLARMEDDPTEQSYTRTAVREKTEEDNNSALPDLGGDGERESEEGLGKHTHTPDSILDSNRAIILQEKEALDIRHSEASTDKYSSDVSSPDGELSLSYDERNYIMTANLYKRILGEKYDWRKAVNVLLAMPEARRDTDTGRDEIESPSVARLVEVLQEDNVPTTQHLFRLYRDIPAPGVAMLSKRSRGYLLRRFANPPNRRWADARRYLALVEDMAMAGLPMSRSLWSSAIHFAGRGNGSGKVLRRDLVRAIGLWQQMEHVAGIPADDVVFNILFDVAVKAGQYTVAGRLEEEMSKRGIGFSRFGMISKIFSYGLRKDVDGISQTFEAFVKSGEIVDTVVLNSLCASYLRAGEVQTAEQLYARMLEAQRATRDKNLKSDEHALPTDPILSSEFVLYRRNTRRLGRLLKKSRALQKHLPEYHRALQNSLPMTPDTRTFYIFLRHFAHQSGQLDKFMSVLHDMEETFAVPPRHIVYMLLFEGFGIHGRRKKSWSAERLRLTWHAYLRALRDSKARFDGFYADTKMTWENPLSSRVTADMETEPPMSDPGGFYMSLPSATTETTPDPAKPVDSQDHTMSHDSGLERDDQDLEAIENDDLPEVEELDVHFFSSQWSSTNAPIATGPDTDPETQHIEHVQKRVENGVFVGRKMIIVILRAFGACCGPKEALEVWLQLERLWHPEHRKANDVFAVKEELDRQMSRDPPSHVN